MYKSAAAAAFALAALTIAPHAAGASKSGTEIRAEDRCDPATFNAVLGEGACVPMGRGTTTFGEFLETLNPADFGDDDWRFNASGSDVRRGETITVKNRGGEFHTFTEVAQFGGGCVPDLNIPLGLQPAPECAPEVAPGVPLAFVTTGIPAGGSLQVSGLEKGTHHFICLIHPWMRTDVRVR